MSMSTFLLVVQSYIRSRCHAVKILFKLLRCIANGTKTENINPKVEWLHKETAQGSFLELISDNV